MPRQILPIIVILAQVLSGCVSNPLVFRGKAGDAGLRIGLTKAQVVSILGYPPEGRLNPYNFTEGSISKYHGQHSETEDWSYQTFDTAFNVHFKDGLVDYWSE